MQDQGHPQGSIPADVERWKHYTSISFATDQCALISYDTRHVGFADRSANEPGAPRSGCVLDNQARRQIDHDCRSFGSTDAAVQHRGHRKRQSVVLPNGSAGLVYEREAVNIGIDCQADGRTSFANQPAQVTEIFRNRFRRTRKEPISLQIYTVDLTAKPLEERNDSGRSGSAYAIQCDLEAALPDCPNVQNW